MLWCHHLKFLIIFEQEFCIVIWCWHSMTGNPKYWNNVPLMPPGVYSFPQSLPCTCSWAASLKHSCGAQQPPCFSIACCFAPNSSASRASKLHHSCSVFSGLLHIDPLLLAPNVPTGLLGLGVLTAFSAFRLGKSAHALLRNSFLPAYQLPKGKSLFCSVHCYVHSTQERAQVK